VRIEVLSTLMFEMPKKDSHQGHLVAIKRRDVLNAREAHLLRVL
jgi:hypothetical protein